MIYNSGVWKISEIFIFLVTVYQTFRSTESFESNFKKSSSLLPHMLGKKAKCMVTWCPCILLPKLWNYWYLGKGGANMAI